MAMLKSYCLAKPMFKSAPYEEIVAFGIAITLILEIKALGVKIHAEVDPHTSKPVLGNYPDEHFLGATPIKVFTTYDKFINVFYSM